MRNMTRVKSLAVMLIVVTLMPTAVGHGASDFQFIMRNQSLQPSEAQLLDNTTMIFYNAADHNRTILVDSNGDGVDDIECEVGPSNASSITDECRIWLEPGKWEAGEYGVKIMVNDTLWNVLRLVIYLDNHTESSNLDLAGPGYSLNENLIDGSDNEKTTPIKIYELAFLAMLITGLLMTIKRGEDN